ncbi:MAG TPA: CHAD domain-containing protein [Bryobacteraceae bacterium]|jgi:CHAD domain-containing protein|nr:CHAD domain-containing protein [Bryobacteraceae bacterium]
MARSVQAVPLLEQWGAEVRRSIQHAGCDEIHDLRVASRRLAQMIAALKQAMRGAGKIRRRLKETIRLAGAVRDYDITAKLLGKSGAPARLNSRLRARRAAAADELVAALRLIEERNLAKKWRAKIPAETGSLAVAAGQLLQRAAKRLFARAARMGDGPRELHKMRIAAKKLRYTMELLPFSPQHLEPIKQLQSKLGDINDYESARRLVAKEGASRKLLDRLKGAQEKKTQKFRRFWKHEFEGNEDGWMAILTHPSETVKSRN